ncbi:MAG TPA: hypothetical protein VHI13_01050 [Candidatus Kapabacteria bacterium]|nr:hypothetical protein [Candidatus Kapabacteria bacterium]
MNLLPQSIAHSFREPALHGRLVVMLAVLLLALLAPLSFIGNLQTSLASYLLLSTIGALALYGGVALFGRWGVEPSRRGVIWGALILRLAMIPMGPSLSDDVLRYVWDGRLLLHGVNPYHYVPADTALARYHDTLYQRQVYRTTHTIYPPGAELVFASCMGAAEFAGGDYRAGVIVWKLLVLIADIGAIVLLAGTMRRIGMSLRALLLYAWHPLLLVELAGQGHTDVFWVLAIAAGLYGYAAGRAGGGIPAIAFGAAMRLHPLTLIPMWARHLRRREVMVGIAAAVPFLMLLLPLLEPTAFANFTGVLARFTNFYEFNGGFYYAVKGVLDHYHIKPSNRIAGGVGSALQAIGILLVWFWPVRRPALLVSRDANLGAAEVAAGEDTARRNVAAERALLVRSLAWRALLVMTLQLALGAKVHVWYFSAPLVLLPLAGRRSLNAAWLWAALAGPFTYIVATGTVAQERMDVVAVEWSLFALLAVYGFFRYRGMEEPGT